MAGPVLRVAEVEKLTATTGNGCVSLTWRAPQRAQRTEVWRKERGIPQSRGDGQKLTALSLGSANDSHLRNGMTYGYRVVAMFAGPDGQPVYSDGVTVTAVPNEPPEPIKAVEVPKL